MISILLAAALQTTVADLAPDDSAELAEQMDVLQDWLAENIGTLEDIAAGFEAVEDDDPAQLGAAWSRALTVNARELSWYQVDDPILLAAQLALEMDILGDAISRATGDIGAEYSIGYDFSSSGTTHTDAEGAPIEAPAQDDDAASDDDTDEPVAEFCDDGELETGTRETPGGTLIWRSCVVRSDSDGFSYLRATQLRAGDEENGSNAMVGLAVFSDDALIRDAMAEPADRVVEAMSRALTLPPAEN
tara:strand:+ start:361 stop:1101 length:741 start_codon:yes stop_codon:yes gene_type:complete